MAAVAASQPARTEARLRVGQLVTTRPTHFDPHSVVGRIIARSWSRKDDWIFVTVETEEGDRVVVPESCVCPFDFRSFAVKKSGRIQRNRIDVYFAGPQSADLHANIVFSFNIGDKLMLHSTVSSGHGGIVFGYVVTRRCFPGGGSKYLTIIDRRGRLWMAKEEHFTFAPRGW